MQLAPEEMQMVLGYNQVSCSVKSLNKWTKVKSRRLPIYVYHHAGIQYPSAPFVLLKVVGLDVVTEILSVILVAGLELPANNSSDFFL